MRERLIDDLRVLGIPPGGDRDEQSIELADAAAVQRIEDWLVYREYFRFVCDPVFAFEHAEELVTLFAPLRKNAARVSRDLELFVTRDRKARHLEHRLVAVGELRQE